VEPASYGYGFSRFTTGTSVGNPNDFLILSNHKKDYLEGFVDTAHLMNSPMVKWSIQNDGACSWRLIHGLYAKNQLDEQMREVVEFNRQHNVNAGYTISFMGVSTRSRGAISLAAKPHLSQEDVDKIWAEKGDEIQLMNNVAHLKIMSLPHLTTSGERLTNRQREALEWVSDGKTTQDIATLMGLPQATVEKHLRLARNLLGVETAAQAVIRAAFQNQIFLSN
jgi:LuxR family transcriptional regulator